jgi:hypothetical protein
MIAPLLVLALGCGNGGDDKTSPPGADAKDALEDRQVAGDAEAPPDAARVDAGDGTAHEVAADAMAEARQPEAKDTEASKDLEPEIGPDGGPGPDAWPDLGPDTAGDAAQELLPDILLPDGPAELLGDGAGPGDGPTAEDTLPEAFAPEVLEPACGGYPLFDGLSLCGAPLPKGVPGLRLFFS